MITIALWCYGLGFLVPAVTTSRPLIVVAIPFIAAGGGTVMTLAYALLMPLMPEHEHEAMTGFYSLSRGIGIIAGPILAGALIAVTSRAPFDATQGFQAVWLVCAAAAFATIARPSHRPNCCSTRVCSGMETADATAVGATGPQLEGALHISNTRLGLLVAISIAGAATAVESESASRR